MIFVNPSNGYKEQISSPLSWLWVLLLGPVYWGIRGVWRHTTIHILVICLTFGLGHLLYPFFTYKILRTDYLRWGWIPEELYQTGGASSNLSQIENSGTLSTAVFIPIAILSILLVVSGLGVAYTFFSKKMPDPYEEISQIIERKMEEADAKKIAEEEAAKGDSKVAKETPEVETFVTTYFEFPGTFTTNLLNSRKFLQVGLGVSTQYDDTVMGNVEGHQLALRSEILNTMSEFSEADVQGKAGREALAIALRDSINLKLVDLEDFGGIQEVHFTSFVLQ